MYQTCLFCHRSLGSNDAISHFPVGRRIALDVQRGRLWAICKTCGAWNLAPIGERWEAIEECEAVFASSRLRVRSANIGLAQVPRAMELVRIGSADDPEFAGWRYGSRLRHRHRWALLMTGAAVFAGSVAALSAGAVMLALATVVGAVAFTPVFFAWDWLESHLDDRVVARVHPPDGQARQLLEQHVGAVELVPACGDETWGVTVPHRSGSFEVRGAVAKQLVSQLLARLNRRGGSRRRVSESVALIAEAGSPEKFIAWAIDVREERRRNGELFRSADLGAFGLTDTERLALEMAVNEDLERAAAASELLALTNAWRDAEEVASIADDLLMPDRIRNALARLRAVR